MAISKYLIGTIDGREWYSDIHPVKRNVLYVRNPLRINDEYIIYTDKIVWLRELKGGQ